MGFKDIHTKIKDEEYELIRRKGYKVADLIRIGLQAKELQESFVSFTLKVAERLESTAKIQEQIADTHKRLLAQQESLIASLNSLATRLDLIATSMNNTANRFDRILERQEKLIEVMEDKFNKLIDKVEELIEHRVYDLEKKLERTSKSLNLSIRVIENSYPKDKATALVEAIAKGDEEAINKILNIEND